MSEPTLYLDTTDNFDDKEMVAYLVTHEALVPVEPCEHGNVYPHDVSTLHSVTQNDVPLWYVDTCPGAGIGGDDAG